MTAKNFCKKDRLYIKSPTQRHRVQKVFSKFNPLFVVLNNISVTQVRVSESKINLLRPLKPLCHQLPSLHDLIISAHVKHHLINLPKMVCSPMQGFFTKKVTLYFVGGSGNTMLYLHIFSHFWKFHPKLLWYKLWPFKQNYLAAVFEDIQYGFEIFQIVLSLNCKTI